MRRDAVPMLTAILFVAGAPVVWGQAAPPRQASAVGPEPATTTASYGDWVLRCQEIAGSGAAKRVCEVVQTMQMQGHAEPLAQVAFGKGNGTDLHFVAALPVNISFPSQVLVLAEDKDSHPVTLDWKRCLPGACFADAMIGSDTLGRWRNASAPAKVEFKDSTGRAFALPMSVRGLATALDALAKMP